MIRKFIFVFALLMAAGNLFAEELPLAAPDQSVSTVHFQTLKYLLDRTDSVDYGPKDFMVIITPQETRYRWRVPGVPEPAIAALPSLANALVMTNEFRHLEKVGGTYVLKSTNDIALADAAYYDTLVAEQSDITTWNVEDAASLRMLIDEINVLRGKVNPALPSLTETGIVAKVNAKIKNEHSNGNHGSNKGKKK